jgi:hypothetical protein
MNVVCISLTKDLKLRINPISAKAENELNVDMCIVVSYASMIYSKHTSQKMENRFL